MAAITAPAWTYPGHATGDDASEARRVAAARRRPLGLGRGWPIDPAGGWMGYPAEDIPQALVPMLAAGARDAFEFETVLVGEEEDLSIDYIVEAADLVRAG